MMLGKSCRSLGLREPWSRHSVNTTRQDESRSHSRPPYNRITFLPLTVGVRLGVYAMTAPIGERTFGCPFTTSRHA